MKKEETSAIATVMVEPDDEKASVVGWVSSQNKPVVIVLPTNVVFRRPGDLLELKRVALVREVPIILVISENERLRQWARRQGFSVYASVETCARALAQRHITEPLPRIYDEERTSTALGLPLGYVAASKSKRVLVQMARDTEPLTMRRHAGREKRWLQRALLVLLALMVLGILGGVGFGYLLLVAHSGAAILPVSLR